MLSVEIIVTIIIFSPVFKKQYGKCLNDITWGRGYYIQLNTLILEYVFLNY